MTKHFSTRLKFAALALAATAAAGVHAAQTSAVTSGTVVAPIAIAKTADLAFGNFAASAAPGTVTISPNGTRTVSGGVTQAGGTTTAAQFDVTGQSGMTYSISLSASTLTSGANNMTFTPISALTASAATAGTVASGTLTGGAQSIYVGGELSVAANQAAGSYSGTVQATVEYN